MIRAADQVLIRARVAGVGNDSARSISSPQIEYFVDDIERTGEPTEKVP